MEMEKTEKKRKKRRDRRRKREGKGGGGEGGRGDGGGDCRTFPRQHYANKLHLHDSRYKREMGPKKGGKPRHYQITLHIILGPLCFFFSSFF